MSEKKKATEATEATEAVKEYDPDELVDYTAPLLPGGGDQTIFGAVNGETFRVKRGVPVKIKRKFYEVLQNAAKQEYAAYMTAQELQKAGTKAAAEM